MEMKKVLEKAIKELGLVNGIEQLRDRQVLEENGWGSEIEFVASVLNVERNAVEILVPQEFEGVCKLFIAVFSSFYSSQSTANPENTYKLMVMNGIIQESWFIMTYLSSGRELSEAAACIFFNPVISAIYLYLSKFRFFYELLCFFDLTITVKQEKPAIALENVVYTVSHLQKFLVNSQGCSESTRKDRLLVIGCNKASENIDINLYDSQDLEKALVLFIPDGPRCFVADMSENSIAATGVTFEPLTKNKIIRLANDYFLAVTEIKCGYEQLLKLQDLNTMELYIFTAVQCPILIGSSKVKKLHIRVHNIEGVSKEHCGISYDYNLNSWILEDFKSTNGTWILLKSIAEFTNKVPSEPKFLPHGNTLLSIGSQKLLLEFN